MEICERFGLNFARLFASKKAKREWKLIISSSYQANNYNPSKSVTTQHSLQAQDKNIQSDSRVSISQEGNNAAASMHDIAAKYNVNDISQKERMQMVTELTEAGLISSGVALHLRAPRSMNEKPNDRSDLLGEMKESLIVDKNSPDSEHMKNKLRAIDILEELRALRS